ncbi:DUF4468 domain-containing protein [Pedobacter sp. GR22-10]|uniref:DUF4468 domain-containing protein n=1 Tax=Pedobacter sp. GR22-10 TaxID=2994472 RepID=UPI002247FD3B|nr:DUF4468 domain-containing protein [Pedobacter sp. GR22-10]MCX2432400.1 DUF4468 domain-containing protein [Pedobacter sp. GR22-10]
MKYGLLLVFTLFSITLSAQQKLFTTAEDGKFIYYKIVDSQKVGKDVLVQRAKNFINTQQKIIQTKNQTDSSLTAKGKLIIDKTVLVVGHPSGEVIYNLNFEARDHKYRFWLTDFKFIPYQRDRYGNFVATTHIGSPLEKKVDKLTSGQWKDIQTAAYQKVEKFGESLKKFLASDATVKKIAKPAETISTKKW